MIETVKRSTPEEVAQLICDLTEESNKLRKDSERLDWLLKTENWRNAGVLAFDQDDNQRWLASREQIDDVISFNVNAQGMYADRNL